jgi:hypothetical protein
MSLLVAYLPGDHDYCRALYGAMSSLDSLESRAVRAIPRRERQSLRDLANSWSGVDLVHVGWPEHLLANPSPGCSSHIGETLELLESLGRSGALVVWTMHNRRPHFWPEDAGNALYARMARLASAVIHHSKWGMREMTEAFPYRNNAIHDVIPHGHYSAELTIREDRIECERRLGLAPCTLRFGVLGRPQPGKRVADIARAFLAGAGVDRQLLVTAVGPDERLPSDPRVARRPRSHWLAREEIAMQVKCCDCLVAWHGGGSHLTSGLVADAIGRGIPMLVNADWEYWREIMGTAAITYVDEDGLAEAFATLTTAHIARGATAAVSLRPAHDWITVAQDTARLFSRAWRAPSRARLNEERG